MVTLLQTLAKSPLVRRSFPNAAATMTQYFAFRKYPNVPISSFLVRAYEDLQEALVRLREERAGPVAIFQRAEDDWNGWRRWHDGPERRDVGATPRSAAWRARFDDDEAEQHDEAEAPPTRDYELLPTQSPQPSEHAAHHELREGGQNVSHMTCHPESGMTTADFFVLDVLRGWRLLQATSLNREEWRDNFVSHQQHARLRLHLQCFADSLG